MIEFEGHDEQGTANVAEYVVATGILFLDDFLRVKGFRLTPEWM